MTFTALAACGRRGGLAAPNIRRPVYSTGSSSVVLLGAGGLAWVRRLEGEEMAKVMIELVWRKEEGDSDFGYAQSLYAGQVFCAYMTCYTPADGWDWSSCFADNETGEIKFDDSKRPEADAKAACEAFVIQQLGGTSV